MDRGWYVVQEPGFEDRIRGTLKQKVEAENASNKILTSNPD